jgi:hypothetical protein
MTSAVERLLCEKPVLGLYLGSVVGFVGGPLNHFCPESHLKIERINLAWLLHSQGTSPPFAICNLDEDSFQVALSQQN